MGVGGEGRATESNQNQACKPHSHFHDVVRILNATAHVPKLHLQIRISFSLELFKVVFSWSLPNPLRAVN